MNDAIKILTPAAAFSPRGLPPTIVCLLTLVTTLACRPLTESNLPVVSKTSELAESLIDLPVSARNREQQISQAAEAVRLQIERIDVDELNSTVLEIQVLAKQLNDVVVVLRGQIEQQDVAELSIRLQALSDRATDTLNRLDMDAYNATVNEIRRLAAEAADRIKLLDIDAANRLVDDASAIRPAVDRTLAEAQALIADLRETVRSLPTAELKRSVAGLQGASTALENALGVLQIVLVVALLPLALISYVAFVWLKSHNPPR